MLKEKQHKGRRWPKVLLWTGVAILLAAAGALVVALRGGGEDDDSVGLRKLLSWRQPRVELSREALAAQQRLEAMEENNYYYVDIDGDTLILLVDSPDSLRAEGRAYWLDSASDCATMRTFSVVRRGENLCLTLSDSSSYCFAADSSVLWQMKLPPFRKINDRRYLKPVFEVECSRDVEYGKAMGYWCSMVGNEGENYGKIVKQGLKQTLRQRMLTLTMDVYQPKDRPERKLMREEGRAERRPLVMFLHGGAFYVGDKAEVHIEQWCRHFAATGYVAVSPNYRMGFVPSRSEIERVGYMAVQDAHAALRYMVAHADEYNIDTSRIFVAGTSAGGITALNVAFMTNHTRPQSSKGKANKGKDLGLIETADNDLRVEFRVRAVGNLWGALPDLDMLKSSRTDIVSFHGDADPLVPYDQGYPFADVGKSVGKSLFGKMYGSAAIDRAARQAGLKSRLYTFEGAGHALHLNKDRSLNKANFDFIRDSMALFFYKEMMPGGPRIRADRDNVRVYYLNGGEGCHTMWQADGGFVLRSDSLKAEVVWREDAKECRIKASGWYANGLGFYAERSVR
ncbi:MAG: alpha/beta hydrolase [Bacteroidales bacterium]|nr:alpha/beta hydrolase [Bacteroidales bacterium]